MRIMILPFLILGVQLTFAGSEMNKPLSQLMMAHYDESAPKVQELREHAPKPRHILILFFSNQCPHCVKFAPLLKHYVETNNWQVEAVSLNGETLPEFPNAIFATQEMIDVAYQGKPVVYPALFIANTSSKALYPVSFGELSYVELQERINAVRAKVTEYEEHH